MLAVRYSDISAIVPYILVCTLVSLSLVWDELGRTCLLVCILIYLLLVVVEPRACQSLGAAWFYDPCGICYPLLRFGSVSLSIELGFVFRPPLMLVIDSGLGYQFRWVYAVG